MYGVIATEAGSSVMQNTPFGSATRPPLTLPAAEECTFQSAQCFFWAVSCNFVTAQVSLEVARMAD
jgi:hypothetical protein